MDQTKTIALFVATALFTSAGLAAASGALTPRSIWGDDNPGQGNEHAAMPVAASEHNQAGADHGNDDQDDDPDDNETGEEDDETGDDDNEDEAGEDDEETGDDDDENETAEDGDENETGEDEEPTGVLRELTMIVPLSINNTEHNWSRNWTHGNVTCSGSGNKTSGNITCSWPDFSFSFWGLNCSISAGSFTKTWSPGNVTWNRTGGDVECTWSWPSHSGSSGSSSTAQAGSRSE